MFPGGRCRVKTRRASRMFHVEHRWRPARLVQDTPRTGENAQYHVPRDDRSPTSTQGDPREQPGFRVGARWPPSVESTGWTRAGPAVLASAVTWGGGPGPRSVGPAARGRQDAPAPASSTGSIDGARRTAEKRPSSSTRRTDANTPRSRDARGAEEGAPVSGRCEQVTAPREGNEARPVDRSQPFTAAREQLHVLPKVRARRPLWEALAIRRAASAQRCRGPACAGRSGPRSPRGPFLVERSGVCRRPMSRRHTRTDVPGAGRQGDGSWRGVPRGTLGTPSSAADGRGTRASTRDGGPIRPTGRAVFHVERPRRWRRPRHGGADMSAGGIGRVAAQVARGSHGARVQRGSASKRTTRSCGPGTCGPRVKAGVIDPARPDHGPSCHNTREPFHVEQSGPAQAGRHAGRGASWNAALGMRRGCGGDRPASGGPAVGNPFRQPLIALPLGALARRRLAGDPATGRPGVEARDSALKGEHRPPRDLPRAGRLPSGSRCGPRRGSAGPMFHVERSHRRAVEPPYAAADERRRLGMCHVERPDVPVTQAPMIPHGRPSR